MSTQEIHTTINGTAYTHEVEPRLLWFTISVMSSV